VGCIVKTGYPQGDIPRFSVPYPGSWDRERFVPEPSTFASRLVDRSHNLSNLLFAIHPPAQFLSSVLVNNFDLIFITVVVRQSGFIGWLGDRNGFCSHIRSFALPWRDSYFLARSESPFTRWACCKVASSLMEGILWSLVGSLRSAGLRLHHRTFRDALARKPGPKSCSENRPDHRRCQAPLADRTERASRRSLAISRTTPKHNPTAMLRPTFTADIKQRPHFAASTGRIGNQMRGTLISRLERLEATTADRTVVYRYGCLKALPNRPRRRAPCCLTLSAGTSEQIVQEFSPGGRKCDEESCHVTSVRDFSYRISPCLADRRRETGPL